MGCEKGTWKSRMIGNVIERWGMGYVERIAI